MIIINKLEDNKVELSSDMEPIEILGSLIGGFVTLGKDLDMKDSDMRELLENAIKIREGKNENNN